MPITIEQIKELKEKATKGKLTIAGGNDVDDYPVCNGLPQQWVYSLVDGVTFAYTPKEEVANLLVRIPEIAQLCLDQAAEIEKLKRCRGCGCLSDNLCTRCELK